MKDEKNAKLSKLINYVGAHKWQINPPPPGYKMILGLLRYRL